MSFESAALLGAWIAIALIGLALSGVMRQVSLLAQGGGRVVQRIGPGPGAPVPIRSQLADVLPHGTPALVLFVDASCSGCALLFSRQHRAEWMQHLAGSPVVLAEVRGAPPSALEVSDRVAQADQHLLDEWNIEVTPFAVALDTRGTVIEATVVGSPATLSDFVLTHLSHFDRTEADSHSLVRGPEKEE